MTKTDLIAQVAANTEMSKKSAEQAVNAVFEALGKAMTEGEKISISGFGTFEVRERAERQGINPRNRFCHAAAACTRFGGFFAEKKGTTQMRLDKYLKVSRLIKRRTVANEVADAGRILINGKVAKARQAVNAGDIIEVTFGNRPIKVRVLSDVEPRTKDVAREMYEVIAE